MQIPVEIVDRVFSFLVWHRRTLVACSKDPLLSPIVEKHLYFHVIVHIDEEPNSNYEFEPDRLYKLVSDNPRILYYVHSLEIRMVGSMSQLQDVQSMAEYLGKFDGRILLMFPVLKDVTLVDTKGSRWWWAPTFRAAVEDHLRLLPEEQLEVSTDFPFSS